MKIGNPLGENYMFNPSAYDILETGNQFQYIPDCSGNFLVMRRITSSGGPSYYYPLTIDMAEEMAFNLMAAIDECKRIQEEGKNATQR